MNKRPTKGQIARALGISPPALTRYIKRGCPTYSIEAARAWQSQNIDPTQRLMRSRAAEAAPAAPAVDADARVQLAQALGLLAAADFAQHADTLRQALRAVPPSARSAVQLPMEVWEKLMPPDLETAIPPDHEGVAAQSDDDAEYAGSVLFMLATGEVVVS